MRRDRLVGWAVVVLMLSVACGEQQQAAPSEELLFLSSGGGVTIVKEGAANPTFSADGALPSRDWSTVIETQARGRSTRVAGVRPLTDTEVWSSTVKGNMVAKVVSDGGSRVALGPARENYYRFGRRTTKLVIAGVDLAEPRTIELKGNFEPEAFSLDLQSLFVLKYRPARAPARYQVRRLDLRSGEVSGVYTVDAELQQAMRGTARVQTLSPDGTRLYTLYTLAGGGGGRIAFVHVLSLDELWAHCVDLPEPFGESPGAAALTTSPDGKRLYVANAITGAIAEIDTEALTVVRTGDEGFGLGKPLNAASGGDDLYLASGSRLAIIDIRSMTERRSLMMPEKIRGLQVAERGRRLYVGLRDRIMVIDPRSGARLDTLDPPGVDRIGRLGRVSRPAKQLFQKVVCAC